MRGVTRYVLGAVVLTVLGAACLAAGMMERRMAAAQQEVAALDYDGPETVFTELEPYYQYGSSLPWIGTGPVDDIRTRRAALQYWQGQYSLLAAQQGDQPDAAAGDNNVELQLIRANAVYRVNQAQAKDQATALKALDAGIEAYANVLRNDEWSQTAAYNYEYLVRLRAQVSTGRGKMTLSADGQEGQFGAGGKPPEDGSTPEFKIYVPIEPEEAGKAGKSGPIERKG